MTSCIERLLDAEVALANCIRAHHDRRWHRSGERIDDPHAGEPPEVAVACQELGDAVLDAERGDVRIVHQIGRRPGLADDHLHDFRMAAIPDWSAVDSTP